MCLLKVFREKRETEMLPFSLPVHAGSHRVYTTPCSCRSFQNNKKKKKKKKTGVSQTDRLCGQISFTYLSKGQFLRSMEVIGTAFHLRAACTATAKWIKILFLTTNLER